MSIRRDVSLRADITFVVPVASLVLDTSGRFRIILDSVATPDGTAFTLSKPLGDSFSIVDATAVTAIKLLQDGFAMNDGADAVDGSTYSFSKGIQNVTFVADSTTQSALKGLSDAFGQLDLLAKSLSRPVSDSFPVTDSIQSVDALKGIPDSITMQDSLETLLLFIRDFDDQVSVSDLRATLFIPSTKVEQITVADDDVISYQKNIADGFAMNDGSEAIDGSQYSIHKGISNVAFVGDLRASLFSTSRLESVSVPDAGLVVAQNYSDLTYFAEDYVGVSQSF
jgi:hypothetical protein